MSFASSKRRQSKTSLASPLQRLREDLVLPSIQWWNWAFTEVFPSSRPVQPTDRARWDWYAESCPCGTPAGECPTHPRARESQRPPESDWRVWGYVAGRGAGKTRAGASWVQHRVEDGTMKLGCLIAP